MLGELSRRGEAQTSGERRSPCKAAMLACRRRAPTQHSATSPLPGACISCSESLETKE